VDVEKQNNYYYSSDYKITTEVQGSKRISLMQVLGCIPCETHARGTLVSLQVYAKVRVGVVSLSSGVHLKYKDLHFISPVLQNTN